MFGQSAPRTVISLVLGVAIVALLGAGVVFMTTDPLTPSGTGQAMEIPAVPETVQPPEPGTEAFERPMFNRDREPGPDGPPAQAGANPSADASGRGDAAKFSLRGIIIGERGARAALQPHTAPEPTWVGAGDTLDGWKVESIKEKLVRLRNGDDVVELKFSGDE